MAADEKQKGRQTRRAVREFIITTFLLGSATLLAILSHFFQQTSEYRLADISASLSLILALVGGLYIVPKLARRINLQLFSWRFPYSATPETAFFLLLAIIVGFSAVNTGNNLLYLIFSVLLAVLIASGIISEASLRNIDVSLRFPEHIFATQDVLLDLSLINRKHFVPSFSLTVGVITEDSEEDDKKSFSQRVRQLLLGPQSEKGLGKLAHYAILPGNVRLSQRIAYTFPQRGTYHITGFMVSTKFPFGFLRKTHEKEAAGEVVVYPCPQPISNFAVIMPALAGWLESPIRGSGSDLYLIRQYVPNDNMRHIDWKATAKARQLMVKEYTCEDERRITIILDDYYDETLPNFLEKYERAVLLAASLIEHFHRQGAELRLLTPEQQTEFGVGQEHCYAMLRILALIQPHKYLPSDEPKEGFKSIQELLNGDGKDFKIVISASALSLGAQARNVRIISLSKL
ncbi:MAG: DUF58 domain-containing protein [Acidobacteriota bacterium]